MWNGMSIGLALSGAIGLACLASVSLSDEKGQLPVRIKAEDLCSGKYEILGRLGKPYGEISNVRAVWEISGTPKKKGFKRSLRITHIDGVALKPDEQVVIASYFVRDALMQGTAPRRFDGEVVDGKVVDGRAYEDGGYVRYPEKVNEILGIPQAADPLSFQYYSFLNFIN
jgi:hypothetical protein